MIVSISSGNNIASAGDNPKVDLLDGKFPCVGVGCGSVEYDLPTKTEKETKTLLRSLGVRIGNDVAIYSEDN